MFGFDHRVKKVTRFELDYSDFEQMVYEAWPHMKPVWDDDRAKRREGFEYMADEECGNDSSQRYGVDDTPLDEWAQEDFDEAVVPGSKRRYISGELLDALCRIGTIPAGDYQINVSY